LERDIPMKVRIIHHILCKNCRKSERDLHKKYKSKRVGYEWFSLDPGDVAWFMSLNNGDLD
jgi:hypothetical protein